MQHILSIYNNFYNDPKKVRDLALKVEYFQNMTEIDKPLPLKYDNNEKQKEFERALFRVGTWYKGTRSLPLDYLYPDLYKEFEKKLLSILELDTNREYLINTYFHILKQDEGQTNIHQDSSQCIIAGSIYLDIFPPMFQGTFFYKDKTSSIEGTEETLEAEYLTKKYESEGKAPIDAFLPTSYIDNKFNRCLIYSSKLFHSAPDGFGDNVNNCRLTQPFFIHERYV